jgi:hypothetical protein
MQEIEKDAPQEIKQDEVEDVSGGFGKVLDDIPGFPSPFPGPGWPNPCPDRFPKDTELL